MVSSKVQDSFKEWSVYNSSFSFLLELVNRASAGNRGLFLELNGMAVRNIEKKPTPSCSMFVALNNGMGVRLTSIPQEYNNLIADMCFIQ